jgi:hypothetical protein
LDKEFYRSTRIQDRQKRFLPRQHERYANETQRPRFSRTTIPAHKYQGYFFIADRISHGEVNLVHCPMGIMIAEFFTKPLQGALFAKFRDIIMGITHFSTLDAPNPVEPRSVLNMDSLASTGSVTTHCGLNERTSYSSTKTRKKVTFKQGPAATKKTHKV